MTPDEGVLRYLLDGYATEDAISRILALANDSGDYQGILQGVINGKVAIERMAEIRRRQSPPPGPGTGLAASTRDPEARSVLEGVRATLRGHYGTAS